MGFITQFLLGLICQTNTLCSHACTSLPGSESTVHVRFSHPCSAPYSTSCSPNLISPALLVLFRSVSPSFVFHPLPFLSPLHLSAEILGKAKHRSLPLCMTRRRWYVEQEAIRANYSDSSSQNKKNTPPKMANQRSHSIIMAGSGSLFTKRKGTCCFKVVAISRRQ